MTRKYNRYHDSMISNYRDLAKKHNIDTSSLSNEEIYNIINSAVAEDSATQEEWFIEDLKLKLGIQ